MESQILTVPLFHATVLCAGFIVPCAVGQKVAIYRDVVVRYVNRLIKVLVTAGFSQDLAIESGRVLSHATVSMTLADLAAPAEPDRPEFFATAVRWLIRGIESDLAARN